MTSKPRFLMCPPDYYEVDYVINPWMEGNIHKSSRATAATQWETLCGLLEQEAQVDRIAPVSGLPDMVFTANAGIALGKKFVLARFLPRERQGEEPLFKKWFKKQGFEVLELPADLPFEGAGDALLDHVIEDREENQRADGIKNQFAPRSLPLNLAAQLDDAPLFGRPKFCGRDA